MSLASEKLYNGYLRRNMPTIASKVKVREILYHLPCLTSHDRENIEVKRETYGNYDSMVLLLDCLKRRENWPEQFIEALEACEQSTLAAEIRAEYEALKGANDSNPSSPPTTVVRAHVHPAPSASHLSGPEGGANSQAAAAPPAEASAPPEPAAQASPPLEISQSSAAQVPEAVSPPEPVPEPPQSTQAEVAPPPSTPPPSPVAPHTQTTTPPPPQRETNSHQEPEENSESDIQDVSADDAVIPDQVSAGNTEVSVSSVDAPQPSRPVKQCETDTASPDPLQTTTTSTEVSPPQSPSAAQTNSHVSDGSSFLTLTPVRPPVQDTSPPGDIKPAAVLQPEETSEPPAAQVIESSPQTEAAATTSPPPGAAGMDAPLCDDSSVCLSKPGPLISVYPQNHSSPTIPALSSPVQPYSGDSERLEISGSVSDAVTTAQRPACSAVSSTTVTTASALPCQETGVTLNHNEPEENSYESPRNSLGMQPVQEHVVHVSEEPSILDLDGQNSTPQGPDVYSEAAKEMASAPPLSSNAADTVSSVNTSRSENHHPSEPAAADLSPEPKTLQDSEETMASRTLPANTKYILTAAGVGACALLIAWRFKN